MWDATPLLKFYARRRLRQWTKRDYAHVQERQLRALLRTARDTKFGEAHGFRTIDNVAQYQSRVPIRDYETFWDEWWRPAFPRLENLTWPGLIPYIAQSSGTTSGRTKSIPVSREMIASNRRAALDVLVHHIANRPASRILRGKSLVLGGSTALSEIAPGVRAGDLSGIAAYETPAWAKGRYFPPKDLALEPDWDRKIERLAELSLKEDIRSLSGTPSWMLLFFERVRAIHGGAHLRDFFPDLELVVHGGVGFAPYAARFAEWLRGSHAELREAYPASEGFFAIADAGPGDGLRLILDNGIFFEFVPVDQLGSAHAERHWIANARTGVDYALILTTNAGLWSYVIGDIVELVSLDPPRLRVTGRTAQALSFFGEHLIGAELDSAVARAAAAIGAFAADYTVAPVHPDTDDSRGGHLFFIEFDRLLDDSDALTFAQTLDVALVALNADYADHRRGDYGMRPPALVALVPGAFAAWMRARGRLGGQNKVPRVIRDPSLVAGLWAFKAKTS